jgi:hypothetical protein
MPVTHRYSKAMAEWLNPTAESSKDFAEHTLLELREGEGFRIDVCTQVR